MTGDIETYTWFRALKEREAVDWIFFEDWKNSVNVAMNNSLRRMVHAVGITAVKDSNGVLRPKLYIAIDKHADPSYVLQAIGATRPHEYSIVMTEGFRILPLIGGATTMPTCGYRNQKYRPVPIGCGTMGVCENGENIYGRPAGCSLGFFANAKGQLAFVSNNHCYYGSVCAEETVCRGKYAVQPDTICGGAHPRDQIGTDVTSKDYGSGVWYVDAAYAVAVSGVDIAEGWLDADQQVHKWTQQITVADPKPGDPVKKHGRGIYTYSTREVQVAAVSTCVDVGCNVTVRRFCDQVVTTSGYISPGDSGSSAWSSDMSTAYGLNFAGNPYTGEGVFNRALRVEQELGIKLIGVKQALPPLPPPGTGISGIILPALSIIGGSLLGAYLQSYARRV